MRVKHTILVVALAAPLQAAATVTNDASGAVYATLGDAVQSASPGDTLRIGPGVYAEAITLDKNLNLVGDGQDLVTLTGGAPATATVNVLFNASVTLTGVTLEATNIPALVASFADVALEDVRLVPTLGNGGANVVATGSGSIDLVDVSFEDTTSFNGGAVLASAVDVTCTRCSVTGSSATDGGAFYVNGGALTLIGGTFDANTATRDGGALYVENAALTLDGTRFTGNRATLDGGAIALVNPTATDILGATFCANTADDGGAIHGTTTLPATLRNTVFAENDASSGGAVWIGGGGAWTLRHLAILGNASGTSGAVHVDNTPAQIVNSVFVTNDGYAIDRSGVFNPTVEYNSFVESSIDDFQNLLPAVGNLRDLDPELTAYTQNGDCTDDQLWPSPYSPLLDAGHPDPAYDDPDGSRSDIGLYGGPDAEPSRHLTDADGDAFSLMRDCDDDDAAVNPDEPEVCDDKDNDCNRDVDDNPINDTTFYPDFDQDGYGSDAAGVGVVACFPPEHYVLDFSDCNDDDSSIFPDAIELCSDGIDSNCDGDEDRDAANAADWFLDQDGDGFGDDASLTRQCVSPGGIEWIRRGGDCDDLDPNIHPDALETCDGVDSNCSGDESDTTDGDTFYRDIDADGFGDIAAPTVTDCATPPGYAPQPGDCNDLVAVMFPDNPEICDGLDNDCNGLPDDAGAPVSWWPDADADGFGASGLQVDAFCPPGPDWVQTGDDCDDDNPNAFLGAQERCDGADNDCDGRVDDADDDVDGTQAWFDFDGDGYGDGDPDIVCNLDGYATRDGDCNDVDPNIHPGVDDTCDGLDNDCDGVVDDGCAAPTSSDEDPPTQPTEGDGTATAEREEDGGCGCRHPSRSPFGAGPFAFALLALRRRRA